MITVKLFGLLRLTYGIRELQLEAATADQVLQQLAQLGIPKKELSGCLILVNSKAAHKKTKLCDGDVVQLMSPVAGG